MASGLLTYLMRNQPNKSQNAKPNARPMLRAVARQKTVDAGFLLGVQNADAKEQLVTQNTMTLDTLMDDSVRDLRALPWISIDERGTRDLDQLSVAERVDDGAIRLRVAIADVDAWVPQGIATRQTCRRQRGIGVCGRRDLSDAAGSTRRRAGVIAAGRGSARRRRRTGHGT